MIFFTTLVLLIISSLTQCQTSFSAEPSAKSLNVAYVAVSGTQAGLWVAQGAWLFRKYGLDTSLVYIAGGSRVIQSMLGGDVQIAAAAPSSAVDAGLGGADLVTVAGMVNVAAFYLVVRPEIKSLQDLRGRSELRVMEPRLTLPCAICYENQASNRTGTYLFYNWAARSS